MASRGVPQVLRLDRGTVALAGVRLPYRRNTTPPSQPVNSASATQTTP